MSRHWRRVVHVCESARHCRRTDTDRPASLPDPERRRGRRSDRRPRAHRRLFGHHGLDRAVGGRLDRAVGGRERRRSVGRRERRVCGTIGRRVRISAAASAAITPNQATTLKDFKPYVPNPTAGSKPPVPNTFSYFVPSASEYFNGLSDAAKQAATDRKIEYGGMVISDADPVKNIDQMNTALQKGIGGMWIQPDDSVAQGQIIVKAIPSGVCSWFSGHPATVQAMADQYDLGYQQALGAVDYITKNLGGKATVVSFILDHIEILIPRKEGTARRAQDRRRRHHPDRAGAPEDHLGRGLPVREHDAPGPPRYPRLAGPG